MTAPATLHDLRLRYRELAAQFRANGLDPVVFAERLRGQDDPDVVREGLAAMRALLASKGLLDYLGDPDNRAEAELAAAEKVETYLMTVPVRETPPAPRSAPPPDPVRAASEPPSDAPVFDLGVEPVADEFYMVGNVPMHVKLGINGHVYARRRNAKTGRWEYAKGAVYAIRERGRVATFDDIAAYGLASGVCFSCGKPLSDPKSVQLGMGPTCRKRYGR